MKTEQKNILLPRRIRSLAALKGINWAAVARAEHLHRTSMYNTITGKNRCRKMRKIIADALEMTVAELWPENCHKNKAS